MKYKAFFSLIFFSIISLHAQQKGRITYSVLPTYGSIDNSAEIKSSKNPSRFSGIDDALKMMEYDLEYCNNKSHFFLSEGLAINEKLKRLAVSIAGSEEFYIDENENTNIKVKNFAGKIFTIQYKINSNWKLTDSTKIVGGYLCYKATLERIIMRNNIEKKIPISAWYCPKIPISFGPKDFNGLPGLILELQDERVTFLVSKIDFNIEKDFKKFEFDTKTEIISQEEFDKIVRNTIKEGLDGKY